MAETKNYIFGTILATLLIGMGIVVLPGDNYYCDDLQLSMNCDRLSSTQKTCYPTPGTTVGKKYCSTGWVFIEYESEPEPEVKPGVTTIITEVPAPDDRATTYRCNAQGCWKVK